MEQVPMYHFFCKAANSSSIALTHLESNKASWTVLGSKELTKAWGEVVKGCLVLDLVTIGWIKGAGTIVYLETRINVLVEEWTDWDEVNGWVDELSELIELCADSGELEDCATWGQEIKEEEEGSDWKTKVEELFELDIDDGEDEEEKRTWKGNSLGLKLTCLET